MISSASIHSSLTGFSHVPFSRASNPMVTFCVCPGRSVPSVGQTENSSPTLNPSASSTPFRLQRAGSKLAFLSSITRESFRLSSSRWNSTLMGPEFSSSSSSSGLFERFVTMVGTSPRQLTLISTGSGLLAMLQMSLSSFSPVACGNAMTVMSRVSSGARSREAGSTEKVSWSRSKRKQKSTWRGKRPELVMRNLSWFSGNFSFSSLDLPTSRGPNSNVSLLITYCLLMI
mmetsp:Transcript_8085/g.27079  ORF Transcript_8085/g.27079 Transcript_8085/m.27079 type:complete len:230 (+) Transcript_8085:6260-6949(+)